jgi:hypothetical protein
MEMNRKTASPVDPEPFALASLLISGCALILQLMQTAKAYESAPPESPGSRETLVTSLDQLRSSVENLRTSIDRTIRAIERGSTDPDAQFFDARYRIDQSKLFLDFPNFDQFKTHLSHTFNATGQMSLWINQIIQHSPALGHRLGMGLSEPLSDMANHLNQVVADGKANRLILEAIRASTAALLDAIDREERHQN